MENCLQNCNALKKGNNYFAHVREYNDMPVSIKVEEVRSCYAKYVYGYRAKTVETGDKNRDDFHCMEMSLVMRMRFVFGND